MTKRIAHEIPHGRFLSKRTDESNRERCFRSPALRFARCPGRTSVVLNQGEDAHPCCMLSHDPVACGKRRQRIGEACRPVVPRREPRRGVLTLEPCPQDQCHVDPANETIGFRTPVTLRRREEVGDDCVRHHGDARPIARVSGA